MALVNLPVILRQMLAANEDDAGGNSPITVFNPVKKGATINTFTSFLRRPLTTLNYSTPTPQKFFGIFPVNLTSKTIDNRNDKTK